MNTRLWTLPIALFVTLGAARAQTNSVWISDNVTNGQAWQPVTAPGDGTSNSCTVGSNTVHHYDAAFYTDQTADSYSVHLYYPSFQAGFVYLYQDAFDPLDPCAGQFVFGYAPVATINNIHLDANRQYFFVTSEDVWFGGGGAFQCSIDGPQGSHMFLGTAPTPYATFCAGDGQDPQVTLACPCGNSGASGHGCENSAGTGGAILSASGTASPDTLVLHANGELPSALSILLQGNTNVAGGLPFGDGIRCVGGTLKRIGIRNASGGSVSFPQPGEPGIRATSASLGDVIPPDGVRYYQVYFRDSAVAFCPDPPGNNWNISNGIAVTWP